MKKTTSSKTSRTPATSSATPPKLAPATRRAPRVIEPAASAAPAARSTAPKSAPTVITAEIDVGFGNALYIRGEGPGLTWEAGMPLECIAGSSWRISIPAVQKTIVFKFLINDRRWSTGDNLAAPAGSGLKFAPAFE